MKINKYILPLLVGVTISFTSCEDFLDTEPDSRTEINTVDAVAKLLAGGYPTANMGVLGEVSSDNIVDNNSPHETTDSKGKTQIVYYNLAPYDQTFDEMFAFEQVTIDNTESPAAIWEGYYNSIAVVNHALQNLDRIEAENNLSDSDKKLAKACRSEGLLMRAFCHFQLVNIFSKAYKNPVDSKNDIGVPYVTEPETQLLVKYERGNVADVYDKIEKDLLKGLENVTDEYYKVPKYRFNKKAAYAFAARFYLFKREYDKVIKYANLVLGENPGEVSGLLRDYSLFEGMQTMDATINEWISNDSPANLLLINTVSLQMRSLYSSNRYAYNHEGSKGTLNGTGPSWSTTIHPTVMMLGLYVSGSADYGCWSLKAGEKFKIADVVAQTGTPMIIRMEFTTEETLLCRAEANIMLGNLDLGFKDLQAWEANLRKATYETNKTFYRDFTVDEIKRFYTKSDEYGQYNTLDYKNTHLMDPSFVVSAEQEPYLNCCLHFRRLETIFSGYRFFDLKRYAIEYSHAIGKKPNVAEPENTVTLTWDDDRKAIELPQDAIVMGLQASRPPKQEDIDSKMPFRVIK